MFISRMLDNELGLSPSAGMKNHDALAIRQDA